MVLYRSFNSLGLIGTTICLKFQLVANKLETDFFIRKTLELEGGDAHKSDLWNLTSIGPFTFTFPYS